MPFPQKIKEKALVACGRCCCICHNFCGTKIEVHHIHEESEGGENTFNNAIPLCFNCHADMKSYDFQHPKGNKYSESELKQHRDLWYEKIKGNNIGIAERKNIVETDKIVYETLVNTLPWNGSINFIRTNNYAGFPFEKVRLNDLHEFKSFCENPAFEFIDPDLESLRASLLKLINQYIVAISTQTFPTSTPGWYSVPEDWEYKQPERFNKIVTDLHIMAGQIIDKYASLVKTATRKLGILPLKITQPLNAQKTEH
jgi:hypothetical protein